MEIDIHKAIYDMQTLVANTPLTEDERNRHNLNIRALRKVIIEWEQYNAEKNK